MLYRNVPWQSEASDEAPQDIQYLGEDSNPTVTEYASEDITAGANLFAAEPTCPPIDVQMNNCCSHNDFLMWGHWASNRY